MDLRIPHSWLQEFCKTSLTPEKIASRVSLSGPSIDRVVKEGGEWLYDAEITTNRPDAFSIIGFAREVAAILGNSFDEPMSIKRLQQILQTVKAQKMIDTSTTLKVAIDEPKLCRRYCGARMTEVRMGPSPKWMQDRLVSSGLRPINVVVDITNYVMLEMGQPTHAFDAQKVSGSLKKQIRVRLAKKGEIFETLDGQSKKLDASMLVIADDQHLLALAGIKGGHHAGIDDTTTDIIVESASFDPVNVRTTSRILDLRTDSSARYEKDLSPEYCMYVLARTVELLQKYAHARIVNDTVDTYPVPEQKKQITFNPMSIERILGITIPQKKLEEILAILGFTVKHTAGVFTITVPFWRAADIEGDGNADIVEEIARIYGYNKLPLEPLRGSIPLTGRDPSFSWERETKHYLKDIGWTESMAYSFLSKKILIDGGFSEHDAIRIHNPLTVDFEYLRPSLIPSMLQALASNEQKQERVALFELSKAYIPKGQKHLPDERLMLCAGLMQRSGNEELLREIKGVVERLGVEWFGPQRERLHFDSTDVFFAGKGMGALIAFGEIPIGYIGVVSQEYMDRWGLKTPCTLLTIDFTHSLPFFTHAKVYTSPSKFPPATRDLAVVLSKEYPYAALAETIRTHDPLIRRVELFDIFENKKLGENKHSLAFHILYQSLDRTLLAEEVDTIHARLIDTLHKKYHAEIR